MKNGGAFSRMSLTSPVVLKVDLLRSFDCLLSGDDYLQFDILHQQQDRCEKQTRREIEKQDEMMMISNCSFCNLYLYKSSFYHTYASLELSFDGLVFDLRRVFPDDLVLVEGKFPLLGISGGYFSNNDE